MVNSLRIIVRYKPLSRSSKVINILVIYLCKSRWYADGIDRIPRSLSYRYFFMYVSNMLVFYFVFVFVFFYKEKKMKPVNSVAKI